MIIIKSLQWYIFIEVLAIIAFVLTFKLFHKLPDKGYCISKILGITLPAFLCWLIMSCSFDNFTFSPLISYIGAGIITILAILLLTLSYSKEDFKNLIHFFDKNYKFILFIEAVFLGIIIVGAYHRGFSPDILNIHKLQEFVYINSLLSCSSLPPDNIWLSGHKINHYYFGYFVLANLVNITFVQLKFAFNLIPGTILAMIAIAAGGFVYNITKSKTFGILGGLFTAFIGNYMTIKQILDTGLSNGYNWLVPIKSIGKEFEAVFPFWSFNLGDIQPYYITHITFLVLIYLAYIIIKDNLLLINNKLTLDSILINILLAVILAITVLTNIYTLPFALIILVILYLYPAISAKNKIDGIKFSLISLLICVVTAIILCLPFILSYKIPHISISSKETILLTDTLSFFLFFGAFLLPIIFFILLEIKSTLKLNTISTILVCISVLSLLEIILIYNAKLSSGIISLLAVLILLSITIFSIYKVVKYNNSPEFFKVSTIIIAILAVLSIEFLVLKSINIFVICSILIFSTYMLVKKKDLDKFVTFGLLFASMFIMIVIVSFNINFNVEDNYTINGYILSQIQLVLPLILTLIIFFTLSSLSNKGKDIYIVIVSIILVPCFAFTLLGPYYKSHKLRVIPNLVPNLSGTNHLSYFHEAEFASVNWLKEYTNPDQVILEGLKRKDTYSGRISGYSGRKTVLQWPKEAQLTYGKKIKRELLEKTSDIKRIYSEVDKTKVLPLIKKYNIEYIYVGEIENKIYPEEGLNSFDQIGTLVFNQTGSNGKVSKIYKINTEPDQ